MQPCEICGREDYLTPRPSAISEHVYRNCRCCHENHAESWPVVHLAINGTAGVWKNLPEVIKDSVTVWTSESYVSIPEGARLLLRQQLTPCPPEEPTDYKMVEDEDNEFDTLWRDMKAVREQMDGEPKKDPLDKPSRFKRLWHAVSSLFQIWPVREISPLTGIGNPYARL